MSALWYRTNTPRVIGEIIDGEAIIIDTETGTYFSLQNVGAFVWQSLTRGARLADIFQGAREYYRCAETEIESHLKQFIDQLETENLVVGSDEMPGSIAAPAQAAQTPTPNRQPFTPPTLDRYEDMQEFLLVDPIHEVDEDGWPSRTE